MNGRFNVHHSYTTLAFKDGRPHAIGRVEYSVPHILQLLCTGILPKTYLIRK